MKPTKKTFTKKQLLTNITAFTLGITCFVISGQSLAKLSNFTSNAELTSTNLNDIIYAINTNSSKVDRRAWIKHNCNIHFWPQTLGKPADYTIFVKNSKVHVTPTLITGTYLSTTYYEMGTDTEWHLYVERGKCSSALLESDKGYKKTVSVDIWRRQSW